ncbi:MAG TPA: dTMP kinase [Symbiobacteriaceae bacterium]|nr:dTMP kinase [Symbiobacteriaceae bacterium]
MAVFITFEGVDGAGKGTQLRLLLEYLQEKGINYIFTREPGGTPLAERIREILLDPANTGMSVITEALLFAAGRADHVTNVIRPALEAGQNVICDRYVDSSMVYQALAGGLPPEFVKGINEMATGGLKPHRTIMLDIPPEVARARRGVNGPDRIEQKDEWYHEQVREGYLEQAQAEPRRFKVVDASGSVESVQAQVRKLVDEVLPRR